MFFKNKNIIESGILKKKPIDKRIIVGVALAIIAVIVVIVIIINAKGKK